MSAVIPKADMPPCSRDDCEVPMGGMAPAFQPSPQARGAVMRPGQVMPALGEHLSQYYLAKSCEYRYIASPVKEALWRAPA